MRQQSISTIFAIVLLCTASCTAARGNSKFVLAGATPGDPTIISMLSIKADTKVDFIRWVLVLEPAIRGAGDFSLTAVFDEAEQNTSGHKQGGESLLVSGRYSVGILRSSEVLKFADQNQSVAFSLVRLNEVIFHILSPDGELMVGDGGWSYSLFRKGAAGPMSSELPQWTTHLPNDEPQEVRFDGRTPCQEFIRVYDRRASEGCYKLKWSLFLFRDPVTRQPSTYKLLGTLYRDSAAEGRWSIDRGAKGAIIYRLDPDRPDRSMAFLAGDENVLFFLTKDDQLIRGNERFGFALNRAVKKE